MWRGGSSPNMMQLLEDSWFALETISSKPFADKQMEQEQYPRIYPNLVLYYVMNKTLYAKKTNEIREQVRTAEPHVGRSKKIVQWIDDVRKKWSETPELTAFINANPKTKLVLGLAYLLECEDLLLSQIWHRQFDCDSPYMQNYVRGRQAVIDIKIVGKEMQRLRKAALDETAPRFHKYVLENYCSIAVPGKADTSFYKKYHYDSATRERVMKSDFRKEFQILEELSYGNRH